MTKALHLLPSQIHDLIRAAEHRQGFKLNIDDFDFLTKATINFVESNIEKFVAGAKEHFDDSGDFVNAVDHATEITKEIQDLWNYQQALIIQLQRLRNRLEAAEYQLRSSTFTSPE